MDRAFIEIQFERGVLFPFVFIVTYTILAIGLWTYFIAFYISEPPTQPSGKPAATPLDRILHITEVTTELTLPTGKVTLTNTITRLFSDGPVTVNNHFYVPADPPRRMAESTSEAPVSPGGGNHMTDISDPRPPRSRSITPAPPVHPSETWEMY